MKLKDPKQVRFHIHGGRTGGLLWLTVGSLVTGLLLAAGPEIAPSALIAPDPQGTLSPRECLPALRPELFRDCKADGQPSAEPALPAPWRDSGDLRLSQHGFVAIASAPFFLPTDQGNCLLYKDGRGEVATIRAYLSSVAVQVNTASSRRNVPFLVIAGPAKHARVSGLPPTTAMTEPLAATGSVHARCCRASGRRGQPGQVTLGVGLVRPSSGSNRLTSLPRYPRPLPPTGLRIVDR